jgi:nucleotide-binding universal stress UspA family protein
MGLYERILVPLDGSPVDEAVLRHVEGLARVCDSEVILLRVAHYHTRDQKTAEEDEARVCLVDAERRLRDGGLAVRTVIGRGEVADVILEQATSLGVDLIAMATHGHGTLPRLFAGSVADKLRHQSSVPLLLVRGVGAVGQAGA